MTGRSEDGSDMPKADTSNSVNAKVSELIHDNRELLREKPVNPAKPKEIKARIDDYLLDCEKGGQLPTVQKLALKMGVDFETFSSWFDPKTSGVAMETIDLLCRAKDTIASIMTDLSLSGELNQTGYTFHAQNYMGLSKDGKKKAGSAGSGTAKERKSQGGKISKKTIEELKSQL